VITGFNTDIDYQGVTYHVQTEDKGLATPLILSLVYDRGTILASKRSPYDDLLADGFDEKVLIERLQKQHKLICAAIRAGRIEDLKRMTMKESALRQKGLIAQKEVKSVVDKIIEKKEEAVELKTEEIPMPAILKKEKPDLFELPEKKDLAVIDETVWDIPLQILEDSYVEVVEEELILPAEAVEIITDFANAEPLDDDKLNIELLTDTTFKGGERKTITLMARRGNQEPGLSGVNILVKIIGSSFLLINPFSRKPDISPASDSIRLSNAGNAIPYKPEPRRRAL